MAYRTMLPPPYNPFAHRHNPADGHAMDRLRSHVSGSDNALVVRPMDMLAVSEFGRAEIYPREVHRTADADAFDLSMRRTHFRLGALEFSFESARRFSRGRTLQPYVERQTTRPSLLDRMFGLVGLVATLVCVAVGSITLWSMKSNADVKAKPENWSIVENASQVRQRPVAAPGVAPIGVAAAPAEKPKLAFAPVPLAMPSEKRSVEDAPSQALSPSASLEMVDTPLDGRPLDQIPAVRDAIKRALATGDMQQWDYGTLTGFVVVGPAQVGAGNCRRGSILARNGGFVGRTQAFERCG
ncbi:hypothetical protein [Sphingobium subterraneum]|uniref:Uncharacterized protein n=1 Tax=Sphingobium subterraneum TaxID=627688 RepID=A0A841IWP0_9SPHN|nr:hypothetical protein [Sphingobium subterraneum]MBB6122690.1 hypothetical protein [Sphingobium subterraneum]